MIWGYVRPQAAASAPVTAPVSENRHEVAPGPTETANGPQIGADAFEPTIAPCGCALALGIDDGLDRLRDMVAGGMGQMEASRAIWGKR